METTERIVEAYVRYVRGWATIPNIQCGGQLEVDLLAIDPVTLARYHIESGVSVSRPFRKLTSKSFSFALLRERGKGPAQRRTIGYFVEMKFGSPSVIEALERYGFRRDEYARVIVSWGWTADAAKEATTQGVELWDFRDLVIEIAKTSTTQRGYFTDDTLRTLHLYALAARSGTHAKKTGAVAPRVP